MQQAKTAVSVVLPRLKAAGVAVDRPVDYFAEMVKSDEHMKKVCVCVCACVRVALAE